jgi:uncharacterized surface protein with fasciclin (FAS1) repeats
MKIHRLLSAAALSLTAGAAFAQAGAPAMPAPAPAAQPAAPATPLTPNGDVMSTLRSSAQFTTFVKALDATNLATLLQHQPNITVFAPTDAAFAALPPGQLDQLTADKTGLQKLLIYHLINARVDPARIKGTRGPWPAGSGEKIVLDGSQDGALKAENATVVQAGVATSNGLIYVVDQVLKPGSVPEAAPEPAPPPAEAAPAPEEAKPAAPAAHHRKK